MGKKRKRRQFQQLFFQQLLEQLFQFQQQLQFLQQQLQQLPSAQQHCSLQLRKLFKTQLQRSSQQLQLQQFLFQQQLQLLQLQLFRSGNPERGRF